MAKRTGRLKRAVGRLALDNGVIEARFNFTATEIKMLYTIAQKVQQGKGGLNIVEYMKDPNDKALYFSAEEIGDIIGIKSNHYDRLDAIFEKLMRSVVTIREGKDWEKFTFLTHAKYKEGIITVQPNIKMIPFYTNLTKKYTLLELNTIMQLKSSYSIRIYTLLKQFEHLEQYNRTMKIDELKKKLGVENLYKRFVNFKVYVLDVAKKELNELLPFIEFDYELIKTQKTYTSIRFHFQYLTGDCQPAVTQDSVNVHMSAYACFKELLEGKNCPIIEAPQNNKQCIYCFKKIKTRQDD